MSHGKVKSYVGRVNRSISPWIVASLSVFFSGSFERDYNAVADAEE